MNRHRCGANTQRQKAAGVHALFGHIGAPTTSLAALPNPCKVLLPFMAPFIGAMGRHEAIND